MSEEARRYFVELRRHGATIHDLVDAFLQAVGNDAEAVEALCDVLRDREERPPRGTPVSVEQTTYASYPYDPWSHEQVRLAWTRLRRDHPSRLSQPEADDQPTAP